MKIIHLKQRHKLPMESSNQIKNLNDVLESIVRSQLCVAQTLIKANNPTIVSEGLSYVCGKDDAEVFAFANHCKKYIFPNGVPHSYETLNSIQKEYLYNYGGAFISLISDNIQRIYPSISKEISDQIHKQFLRGDFSRIFSEREEQAVQHSIQAAIQDNSDTVYLVFGSKHDFSFQCLQHENVFLTEIDCLDVEREDIFYKKRHSSKCTLL